MPSANRGRRKLADLRFGFPVRRDRFSNRSWVFSLDGRCQLLQESTAPPCAGNVRAPQNWYCSVSSRERSVSWGPVSRRKRPGSDHAKTMPVVHPGDGAHVAPKEAIVATCLAVLLPGVRTSWPLGAYTPSAVLWRQNRSRLALSSTASVG